MKRPAGGTIVSIAVVVLVTLFFFSLYWNHFAGLRSGGSGFVVGSWLLEGWLPYRDHFFFAPPLYVLKSAAVLLIFGQSLAATLAVALVQRLALAVLIYLWLSQMFGRGHAAFASVVTTIIGSADLTDPLDSYNWDAAIFVIAAGVASSYCLSKTRSLGQVGLCGILSGLCLSLSLGTKQTVGLAALVALPVVTCVYLWRFGGARRAIIFLAAQIAGCAVVIGSLLWWLNQSGTFQAFIDQSFVYGPAAKAAHPQDFLLRHVGFMVNGWFWAISAAIGLLLSWPILQRSAQQVTRPPEPRNLPALVLVLAAAGVALGAGGAYLRPTAVPGGLLFSMDWFMLKSPVLFVLLASTFLCLVYGLRLLQGRISWRESQFLLYAATSFVIAASFSLSFPIMQLMIVPGLGLWLAAILEDSGRWLRPAIHVICMILIAGTTYLKLYCPHAFEDFYDPPVPKAHSTSKLSALKGLVLPEEIVRLIDDTVAIIRENSSSQDTIYCYPELSLFYPLSGRHSTTFCTCHNMDVANDQLAMSDASRLLTAKPAVLIYYREKEETLRWWESVFRGGKRSGNRAIIAACERLAKEYRLARTFALSPPNPHVMVFVRPTAD